MNDLWIRIDYMHAIRDLVFFCYFKFLFAEFVFFKVTLVF